MFDIGFSEMMVVGVVALIVIGPEKLPKVARTAGILLGRAQRYVNDVKADINRQIQAEEMKQLQEQITQQALALEASMKKDAKIVEEELYRGIEPPPPPSDAANPPPDKPAA